MNGFNSAPGQRREPYMPRTLEANSLTPLTIEVDPVPEGPELSFAYPNDCNGQINPIGSLSMSGE